ncbi:MAG: protein translocase subunit SecD [Alphaproteobacteria bacterium]|nr:protein translocase subunit SecD [Alphaproteobacteria bacterium]
MVNIPRWQIVLVIVVCVVGIAFAIPNLFSRQFAETLPDWLPHKQISLGLDLQGGSHLLLEVETGVIIEEELESVVDEIRTQMRAARLGYTGLGASGTTVSFTVRDVADMAEVEELVRELAGALAEGGFVANIVGSLGQTQAAALEIESTEDGEFRLILTEAMIADRKNRAIQQSLEVIRRRIDELGTREPTIQRQGEERIIVEVPGVEDPEDLKALLQAEAKMTFHLVDHTATPQDAIAGRAPPGSMILPNDDDEAGNIPIVVKKRVVVSGDHLIDAQPTIQDGRPVVSFRFDTVGARKFGETTQQNVGRQLAIVLDKKVISAPVIRDAILGGNGIITGTFSVPETQELSLLLRAGALPAPLKILEERTVGPGLGADSIAAGEIAAIIGMIMVVVFMAAAYGLFGAIADVALIMNIILIAGALSLLQATLTLPGIAGIVLTIGMAVDANVLIFERIREEARSGRTPISAIDAGYRRALTTIIDSNVTTLIAAVLLFQFGSGPIRGFAVTLSIGILTSMFTAIMVTRLLVVGWLRRKRPAALPI